jgi:hypothetical protein
MDEIRLPKHVVNRIGVGGRRAFVQIREDWNVRSARLRHPPTDATILFDHRKFGGCWRDSLGPPTPLSWQ